MCQSSPEDKRDKAKEAKLQERREAARWQRILRTYGITKEEFEELDLGYCPICLRKWSEGLTPCVDHDHRDLWVRGIVCRYCNKFVIGRHRDPDELQRVVDYLRGPFKHKAPPPKRKKRKRKKSK